MCPKCADLNFQKRLQVLSCHVLCFRLGVQTDKCFACFIYARVASYLHPFLVISLSVLYAGRADMREVANLLFRRARLL
jgi:hypothetical protein